MKAVIKKTSEIVLTSCPEFIRAGYRVYGHNSSSYRLPTMWSLIYFDYEANVELDDVTVRVNPGYVALLPPGVKKTYHFEGNSPHYTVHFRENDAVAGGNTERSLLPWLIDTGKQWLSFLDAFKDILEYQVACPTRAQMRLWDILYRLSDALAYNCAGPLNTHPAVKDMMRLIESGIDGHLSVGVLAKKVGLSPSHLTVLCRQYFGLTVQQYIKKQRSDLARYLLVNTDMAIKEVAVDVGMADLQYFNKSIHAAFGMSPRAFRRSRH